MTTQEIQYEVQADGKVVLEGLRFRRGQKIRLVLITEDEAAATRPTPAEVLAHLEKMRGSVLWDDSDPGEPAVDPSEWDANRG